MTDEIMSEIELLVQTGLLRQEDRDATAAVLAARRSLASITTIPVQNTLDQARSHLHTAIMATRSHLEHVQTLVRHLEPLRRDARCKSTFITLDQAVSNLEAVCRDLRVPDWPPESYIVDLQASVTQSVKALQEIVR
jgi:hypothetical protein